MADNQKPNRFNDHLQNLCDWDEIKAAESRQMHHWEALDKKRERIRKKLRFLIFLCAVAIALLLAVVF